MFDRNADVEILQLGINSKPIANKGLLPAEILKINLRYVA